MMFVWRSATVFVLLGTVLAGFGAAAPQQKAAPQQQAETQQKSEPGQTSRRDPTQMIKGKWQAKVAGRTYALDLRVEDGDLVGTVLLPNHKTVKVQDGICVSDEFSFTTVEDEIEWEWNGTISDSGLAGERERFDTDATEAFTATRTP
jgi:hypothetical protein